jgi:hypothetical protein
MPYAKHKHEHQLQQQTAHCARHLWCCAAVCCCQSMPQLMACCAASQQSPAEPSSPCTFAVILHAMLQSCSPHRTAHEKQPCKECNAATAASHMSCAFPVHVQVSSQARPCIAVMTAKRSHATLCARCHALTNANNLHVSQKARKESYCAAAAAAASSTAFINPQNRRTRCHCTARHLSPRASKRTPVVPYKRS